MLSLTAIIGYGRNLAYTAKRKCNTLMHELRIVTSMGAQINYRIYSHRKYQITVHALMVCLTRLSQR